MKEPYQIFEQLVEPLPEAGGGVWPLALEPGTRPSWLPCQFSATSVVS